MAILKKFTQEYTQTPNALLNRKDVSLKAKGTWTFLNSKPEGWNFSVNGIKSQNKDGKESVTSGLKELEKERYLKRVAHQDKNGKFNGYDYHLFDKPFVKTEDEETIDGKPVNGKHGNHSNTNTSKKEQVNTLFSKQEEQPAVLSKDILRILNESKPSKIDFKHTSTNLKGIEARIKEGYKFEDFKKVIFLKIAEWKDSDKMKKFIRPETLFGSKFNGYLVESGESSSSTDGSGNFEYKPQEKAEML